MSEEVWSQIPGLDYEASNTGRIRSMPRWRSIRSRRGKQYLRFYDGKILKLSTDTGGYLTVTLGHADQRRVHCLVMLAFVGPPPDGEEVCHDDGDRQNARLDNLSYGTRAANVADTVRHGTAWWLNGPQNSQ